MEFLLSPEFLGAVLAAVLGVQGLAVLITKLTPTPADDEAVSAFYRVVYRLAGLTGVKPGPQAPTPKEPTPDA